MLINTRMLKALYCCCMAAIIVLSVIPSAGGPPAIPHLDKIGHFCAYGVLALLGWFAWNRRMTRLWLPVFSIVLGGMLEIMQHFIPGREMTFADGLANSAGVIAGVVSGAFPRLKRLRMRGTGK